VKISTGSKLTLYLEETKGRVRLLPGAIWNPNPPSRIDPASIARFKAQSLVIITGGLDYAVQYRIYWDEKATGYSVIFEGAIPPLLVTERTQGCQIVPASSHPEFGCEYSRSSLDGSSLSLEYHFDYGISKLSG
jgi:hypothetical protein